MANFRSIVSSGDGAYADASAVRASRHRVEVTFIVGCIPLRLGFRTFNTLLSIVLLPTCKEEIFADLSQTLPDVYLSFSFISGVKHGGMTIPRFDSCASSSLAVNRMF